MGLRGCPFDFEVSLFCSFVLLDWNLGRFHKIEKIFFKIPKTFLILSRRDFQECLNHNKEEKNL